MAKHVAKRMKGSAATELELQANGNNNEDDLTNLKLEHERHRKSGLSTLALRRKKKRVPSGYGTVRGNGFEILNDMGDEPTSAAHIRDTKALMTSDNWGRLVSNDVTHLTLEDDDNALKTLPPEMVDLKALRSLSVKWGRLRKMPIYVFNMSLSELHLSDCRHLTDVDGLQLATTLVTLELVNNSLKALPRDLGALTQLTKLDVSGNKLKALPLSIGEMSQLRYLAFASNSVGQIPVSMGGLKQLEILDGSKNHIQALPETVGDATAIIQVRLSNNKLAGLPGSIRHLIHLKHLFLADNKFAGVPPILGELPNLSTLNLKGNAVTVMNTTLPKVTRLILDDNRLTEFPESLVDCSKLEFLSMQRNKLTELSPKIAKLSDLKALYVGGNDITVIPDQLCKLENLRHLVLRETKVAELPVRFDRLSRLSLLDVEETPLPFELKHAYRSGGILELMERVRCKREHSQSSLEATPPDSEEEEEDEEDEEEGEEENGEATCGETTEEEDDDYTTEVALLKARAEDAAAAAADSGDIKRHNDAFDSTTRRDLHTLYPQFDDNNDMNLAATLAAAKTGNVRKEIPEVMFSQRAAMEAERTRTPPTPESPVAKATVTPALPAEVFKPEVKPERQLFVKSTITTTPKAAPAKPPPPVSPPPAIETSPPSARGSTVGSPVITIPSPQPPTQQGGRPLSTVGKPTPPPTHVPTAVPMPTPAPASPKSPAPPSPKGHDLVDTSKEPGDKDGDLRDLLRKSRGPVPSKPVIPTKPKSRVLSGVASNRDSAIQPGQRSVGTFSTLATVPEASSERSSVDPREAPDRDSARPPSAAGAAPPLANKPNRASKPEVTAPKPGTPAFGSAQKPPMMAKPKADMFAGNKSLLFSDKRDSAAEIQTPSSTVQSPDNAARESLKRLSGVKPAPKPKPSSIRTQANKTTPNGTHSAPNGSLSPSSDKPAPRRQTGSISKLAAMFDG